MPMVAPHYVKIYFTEINSLSNHNLLLSLSYLYLLFIIFVVGNRQYKQMGGFRHWIYLNKYLIQDYPPNTSSLTRPVAVPAGF